MNFLANIYLWLLPLVSIPLIIYLFNRSKYKNYQFSSIKFLIAINKKSIKKINILNILLLIIRTLIILFFIIMMTRPFYSSNFDSSKKSSGYALIVIDNSLSMHQHIDNKLKNTIRKIVDPLDDKFKVHIVTLDDLVDVYSGLKKNIEFSEFKINKTTQNTSLTTIFKYALSRENVELNRYLFILSDGQVNSQIENNSDFNDLEDWNITYINMGKPDVNVCIYNVSTNSNFISTNNKFTINADLLNNGNTFIENNLVELYINEVNIGKQYIDINEDELEKVSFQLSLPEDGAYKCYIKSQYDDRVEDNIFYFSLKRYKSDKY